MFRILFALLISFGTVAAGVYDLNDSLSGVVNLADFKNAEQAHTGKTFAFTAAQTAKLVQNCFVVTPTAAEQFFHIYESQHYGTPPRIPNFITSDCILQLYHMFFDFTLRAVEVEKLLPALDDLTREMRKQALAQEKTIKDPALHAAAVKNAVYFSVAAQLLGMTDSTGIEAVDTSVAAEVAAIKAHASRAPSDLLPFALDFTQFIPRGHYAANENLQRYFLAMMWYGQCPFPFYVADQKTEEQARQALLITHTLFTAHANTVPLVALWDKVYNITTSYVGAADDLTPYDYRDLMDQVYGDSVTVTRFADGKLLDAFYAAAAKLPRPRIQNVAVGMATDLQFRFMGQRFIIDSYVLQELSLYPVRSFPKGLDVMAVLGSSRAVFLLDSLYKEAATWPDYPVQRSKLVGEVARLEEKDWMQSLYSGWLYALKALIEERGREVPPFMRTTAWSDKQLNTALASWAEARHDIILYAKPSVAEGGDGGEEPPPPRGYVEPVPLFFSRLHDLTLQTHHVLRDNDVWSEDVNRMFDQYVDWLAFLTAAAEKELRGEALDEKELRRIQWFGSMIEGLSLQLVELDRNLPYIDPFTGKKVDHQTARLRGWYEVVGTDQDVACIADVHTSLDSCLEEATGHLSEIYVIVPVNGKLYLTRGAVFSYYEFHYAAGHRLDDEAWQEMLKRERAPRPPSWTDSFMTE